MSFKQIVSTFAIIESKTKNLLPSKRKNSLIKNNCATSPVYTTFLCKIPNFSLFVLEKIAFSTVRQKTPLFRLKMQIGLERM